MISAEGVRSDPHKIRAVEQWPFPAKVLDGRSFLGLALYYHRFIGDFVEIAVPFHHLTAKSTEGFRWSTECDSLPYPEEEIGDSFSDSRLLSQCTIHCGL